MTHAPPQNLQAMLKARYSDAPEAVDCSVNSGLLCSMLARGSCRAFSDQPVPMALLDLICAAALASPTKSDLQQRDIVLLRSADLRRHLSELVSGQAWVAGAPMIAVFCGNNRRQRLLHHWHDVPFANDHLDAFFNATTDAAIALGAFVTAAEVMGLGCCPISAVRNEAEAVSTLLELPDHVFPIAGLAIGFPSDKAQIAKRLPLEVTRHIDRYSETDLKQAIQTYDTDRATTQPYAKQRFTDQFGQRDAYAWSDDKVRQYSRPERDRFGAYVRARGFCLD